MGLTSRAQRYLSTLKRGRPVPIGIVAEVYNETTALSYVWRDFHLRFAGYEEEIGEDKAVWGLAHAEPLWGEPWEVDLEPDGSDLLIVCADVHPSYNYVLNWYTDTCPEAEGHVSYSKSKSRGICFLARHAQNRSWKIQFKTGENRRCNLREVWGCSST